MGNKILLVEDDRSLNRAVSLKLQKEGYDVYSADCQKQARELYEANDISLIICDIGLPDGNGLDFCMRVRESERAGGRTGRTVFLFLTAMDTETDMINGYEAGGDDYVTKPFSLVVLISKVNAIMSRYGGKSGDTESAKEAVIRSGDITLYVDKNRAAKNGEFMNLTANEQKLLRYFMENPMTVLSKSRLLAAIWDIDGNFVDDNTVAVNIRRLREKVEDDPSKPSVIRNIRGLGYIWERECEKL